MKTKIAVSDFSSDGKVLVTIGGSTYRLTAEEAKELFSKIGKSISKRKIESIGAIDLDKYSEDLQEFSSEVDPESIVGLNSYRNGTGIMISSGANGKGLREIFVSDNIWTVVNAFRKAFGKTVQCYIKPYNIGEER